VEKYDKLFINIDILLFTDETTTEFPAGEVAKLLNDYRDNHNMKIETSEEDSLVDIYIKNISDDEINKYVKEILDIIGDKYDVKFHAYFNRGVLSFKVY